MLMGGFTWGCKSGMNYVFGCYGLEVPAGMSNDGDSGQEKSWDMLVSKFIAGISEAHWYDRCDIG
jgi:hypothetical protein